MTLMTWYGTHFHVLYRTGIDVSQWDLGEFNQKGSIATRWGTKNELLEAIGKAKTQGIDVLIDAVLNVSPVNVSDQGFWLDITPLSSINSVRIERRHSMQCRWTQRTD